MNSVPSPKLTRINLGCSQSIVSRMFKSSALDMRDMGARCQLRPFPGPSGIAGQVS